MSTRYMKRVYGRDDVIIAADDKETASDDVDIDVPLKSKGFNVFDLLNQNSDKEEEEEEHKSAEESQIVTESEGDESRKKRKKKKRRKPDNRRPSGGNSNTEARPEGSDIEDEIERTVREVNKLLGEPLASASKDTEGDNSRCSLQKSKESILSVQHKHLNPFNELKKVFGSKTVQAEQSKRRSRGRSGHLKKTWLVSPKDYWQPIGKSGLSMTLDTSMPQSKCQNGVQYFVLEHNAYYRDIQMKFLQAVESSNTENIIDIVSLHHYHVDGLLQVAELCKLDEDLAIAADMTERAVYALECAFHPLFNLTTANCRLDYRKQQNRCLFVALFRHLMFISGQACYRTSLEFCKLLLSLDPEEDPLAIVLALDFYALRAREYRWFIEFCELWENARNLTQLPNIAYSLALAHFHSGNRTEADESLQQALIMFPGVLVPLLDKCSIQPDSQVRGNDYFNSKAKTTTPAALEKLEKLYVARSYHLWKEADILPWLEVNVHSAIARVNSGTDAYVKFCQVKRKRRYQGNLPRNILRHIILSDIKDVTAAVQEVGTDEVILSNDPLPPLDSINIYSNPRTRQQQSSSSGNVNQHTSNLLSLFFSSLFVDLENDPAAAAALNQGVPRMDENRRNDNEQA